MDLSRRQFQEFIDDPRPLLDQWSSFSIDRSFDEESYVLIQCKNLEKESTISNCKMEESSNMLESLLAQHQIPEENVTVRRTDNEKNRCAYMTKKIVLFFVGTKFRNVVKKICQHLECIYAEVRDFYKLQLKVQFGINHLNSLMAPMEQNEVKIKKVFRIFMKWFLRQKYLVYLVKHGKMANKESYIDYKNRTLLYMDIIEFKDEQLQFQKL